MGSEMCIRDRLMVAIDLVEDRLVLKMSRINAFPVGLRYPWSEMIRVRND